MHMLQQEMPIAQLASLLPYHSFGGWLKAIRDRYKLTQKNLAEVSKPYLLAADAQFFNRGIIGALEHDDRYPLYKELEPLYRCLVDKDGFALSLSADERDLFLYFARKRIGERQKGEHVSEQQWNDLTTQLILLTPNRKQKLQLIRKDEPVPIPSPQMDDEEDPHSRRRKAIEDARRTDTEHLLERQEWLSRMLAYTEQKPAKKLVVVQGAMGVGKTFAKARLIQHFVAECPGSYLIPYTFGKGEQKTPEDHLNEYLAATLADLTRAKVSEEAKVRPLEQRIEQVMAAIKARSSKVILLLDGAQCIFPAAGQWSASWAQFFEVFTREPHGATMYLFSRVWSGWSDHPLSYVTQTDLSELSPQACLSIWHHQGFGDVPDDLLRDASARCGHNPHLVEMLIGLCQKRSITTGWGRSGTTSTSAKSANQERLEALLSQETIFTKTDPRSRAVLRSMLTGSFSHQAQQLLEALACSPLGLPLSLLVEEIVGAEDALSALDSASTLDLSADASGRAALVPIVRECVLQSLLYDGRLAAVQDRVTSMYAHWLESIPDFKDDHEKAALVTEIVVRYIRAGQLLKAADLFIRFSWLCALFGQVSRIKRIFDEHVSASRGKEEETNHEVGRLILWYQIDIETDKEITIPERHRIYQYVHGKVLLGEVTLYAHTELDVLFHVLLAHINQSLFVDARRILDETLIRLQEKGQILPEIQASYLGNKARLFARWWDKMSEGDQKEVACSQQECLAALKESIAQWRLCLKNALPLQTKYYNFKMARTLNDYAYRCRLAGDLITAQEAIEECLRLKKGGDALARSLSISLSEYSQILSALGQFQKARACNEEACAPIEDLVREGDTSLHSELGMLLIERATIARQQACLEEANALLERGISLIPDTASASRLRIREQAKRDLTQIRLILETGQHYQLDSRWFPRYHKLVSYNDISWLEATGPFTDEEQREWEDLIVQREEPDVADRMTALIIKARQREFESSQREMRAPVLCYPRISLNEVRVLIRNFIDLQKEIEEQETHAIVRSLYRDAINEHIIRLRQCEAIALRDRDTVWQCYLSLYEKPTPREVYIALRPVCQKLVNGQKHVQASPFAQSALQMLETWGLVPRDIAMMEFFPPAPSSQPVFADNEREFSYHTVQRFLQSVLVEDYQAYDWVVEIAEERTFPYIDVNLKKIFLPAHSLVLADVREFLNEEVEVHAYRSLSGAQSALALLSSGLAGYHATEEGLAEYWTQQMHHNERDTIWMGPLATGLASGILNPPLTFTQLATFLENYFIVSKLLSDDSLTYSDTVAQAARQRAWMRAARTYRGVPHLEEAGVNSLRDIIYLRGYLAVKQELEKTNIERLLVGKIGMKDLEVMSELNILAPPCPNLHIAFAPNLLERVCQFEK